MPTRSLQEAVDALGVALGAPVVLEDADQQPLAHSPHVGVSDAMRDTTILQRASGPEVLDHFARYDVRSRTEPFVVPGDDAIGVLARLCVPLRDEAALIGFVWALLPDGDATAEQLRTAGDAVPELLAALRDDRHLDVEEAAIVDGLVSEDGDGRAAALGELRRRGIRDGGPWLVVAVTGAGLTDPVVRRRVRAARFAPRGAAQVRSVGEHAAVVVVVGADDVDAVLGLSRRSVVALGDADGPDAALAVGLGDGQVEAAGLAVAVGQARAAARWAAAAVGGAADAPVAAWRDLGVGRALTQLTEAQLEAAVDPRVRRLIAGDEQLAATLERYLDVAGSAADAATALHVHRATLYQRLERIGAGGIDVRRGGDRTAAHVSFAALRLLGAWPR
jgi:hypothetical protein